LDARFMESTIIIQKYMSLAPQATLYACAAILSAMHFSMKS